MYQLRFAHSLRLSAGELVTRRASQLTERSDKGAQAIAIDGDVSKEADVER